MVSSDAHRQRGNKQTTDGKTEDEGPLKMYPPVLFQFSPTYNDWARLTAKDVHSLIQPPEMMGQLAWFNLNNPIRYVRLVGYIVGVTPYEEKTIISLDDSSTMLIDCVIIHAKTNLDPNSFYPGQLIKAKGEIMRFRDQIEVRLRRVEVIEYIDDEVEAWESTLEWKKKYWNKPWILDEENARAKLAAKEEQLEANHKEYVGKRRGEKSMEKQNERKKTMPESKQRNRDESALEKKSETVKKRKRTETGVDEKMEVRKKIKVEVPQPMVKVEQGSQKVASQSPRSSRKLRQLETPRPTPIPVDQPKAIPKTPRKTEPVTRLSRKKQQSQEDKENTPLQECNASPMIEVTDSMLDALDYSCEISMLATQRQGQQSADKSFEYPFTESILEFLDTDSFCTTVADGQDSQSGYSTVLPDDTTVTSQRRFTGHRRSRSQTAKRKREETDDAPPSAQLEQNTPNNTDTLSQLSGRKRFKADTSITASVYSENRKYRVHKGRPARIAVPFNGQHTEAPPTVSSSSTSVTIGAECWRPDAVSTTTQTSTNVDISRHEHSTQRKFIGRQRTKESSRPAESLNMAVTKFSGGFRSAREALRKDDARDIAKSTVVKSCSLDSVLAEADSSSPSTGKFIGKRRTPYSSARPMRPPSG